MLNSFYKLLIISLCLWVFPEISGQSPNYTLDFETGDLRGWTKSGTAFNNQPTFGDNSKFRGKPSGHQGNYWIGTFENYRGKEGENPGSTQGDKPTGKLISPIFTIPSGTLSFLVGGGRDRSSVFVELVIIEGTGEFNEKTAFRESGENRETMRRVTWNLNQHSNKQGRIRIVDASSEPWGHINVDDFKFTTISIIEVQPINSQELINPDNQEMVLVEKIKPEQNIFKTSLKLVTQNDPPFFAGQPIKFLVEVENYHDNMLFQFHFGDGNASNWNDLFSSVHVYENEGTFRAFCEVRIGDKTVARSNVILIKIIPQPINYELNLEVVDKNKIEIGTPARFRVFLNPEISDVEYNFDFGDNTERIWTGQSEIEHFYTYPDLFRISVIARKGAELIAKSEVEEIEVIKIDYQVRLFADQLQLSPGEAVEFWGEIEPASESVNYKFNFGDEIENDWLDEPIAEHTFIEAGEFPVQLTAEINGKEIQSNIVTIRVEEIEFRAFVQAEPEHALPGQPINFRAIIEPFVEGVEYQFIFGDKKKSDWSFNSTAHHSYSKIGIHEVSVKVRRDNKIISVSEQLTIEIIKTAPSINLYLIIGGVIMIIGGGYLLIRKLSGRKKIVKTPSYSIHINPEIDIGDQRIESDISLNPNMGLRFKPVKDIGSQIIETDDSSIND